MMPWFKHYNNAQHKKTITELENTLGVHIGYACYFKFTEHCHSIWDGGNPPNFRISVRFLKNLLQISPKKLSDFTRILTEFQNCEFKKDGEIYDVVFRKLAEMQDKHSKYNKKRVVTGSLKTTVDKEEDKDKDKEEDIKKVTAPKISRTRSVVSKDPSKGTQVWFSYAKAYEAKYANLPIRNAKTNSMCSKLVSYVGLEDAIKIVDHFLKIDDSFYIRKAHDLGLCLSDYQKILTTANTGINITGQRARQIENKSNLIDVMNQLGVK